MKFSETTTEKSWLILVLWRSKPNYNVMLNLIYIFPIIKNNSLLGF